MGSLYSASRSKDPRSLAHSVFALVIIIVLKCSVSCGEGAGGFGGGLRETDGGGEGEGEKGGGGEEGGGGAPARRPRPSGQCESSTECGAPDEDAGNAVDGSGARIDFIAGEIAVPSGTATWVERRTIRKEEGALAGLGRDRQRAVPPPRQTPE